MREIKEEEKERKSKTSFHNPRSSIGQNLSSQELKFIASTRATRVYQKGRICNALKIPKQFYNMFRV